uniref:Uncharacterized protein n=1 Tax=Clastoptera arizonana TaxID=38151 RepID=A0A1B6DRT9_9HEMI
MENMKTDYLTTYKKSYKSLPIERSVKATFSPDYLDPLSGPFTYYVKPKFIFNQLEDISDLETSDKCFHRLIEEYPVISRHIHSEPDQDVIEKDYRDLVRTVYQVDICKMKNGITSKKTLARKRVNLPEDWGEVPQTTHRAAYRDIRKLATWDLTPKSIVPPKATLDPNMKEREILQIKTGQSEYEGRIGQLGEDIVRHEMHGHVDDFRSCKIYEALKKRRLQREELRKH